MNIEEAKSMVGTEFTYVYPDGDTIQAYVKKFDPAIGFTCMTLETKTRDGYVARKHEREEDGTWCVIAFNFAYKHHPLKDALSQLEKIKKTGKFKIKDSGGSPSCAFI